jgi:nitroimidazol reductase NimA-like FMN-containing flavoprotein (pyridoxamine 5'-phosphate oxidase superfamily)
MPTAMTTLAYQDCLRRLAEGSTGRIAISDRALPVIVPVAYAVSGHAIVFRTEPGGMLARACDDAVVAFEIDQFAADGTAGWSVLVVGMARLLSGSEALRALELGLVGPAGPELDQFVGITIGEVSGRQTAGATAFTPALSTAAQEAS